MAMSLRASLLALLACSACQSSAKDGPVLVKGVGLAVTAADLKDRLVLENEPTRSAVRDPAKKRGFLARVIDEELQLAEARRQKLDQSPEFKAMVRSLLLQELRTSRARARNAGGPVDAVQQEAEQQAWVQSLREQAKLELDDAAVNAFVP